MVPLAPLLSGILPHSRNLPAFSLHAENFDGFVSITSLYPSKMPPRRARKGTANYAIAAHVEALAEGRDSEFRFSVGRAAKSIRECPIPIRSKEDAKKIRHVGDFFAAQIESFLLNQGENAHAPPPPAEAAAAAALLRQSGQVPTPFADRATFANRGATQDSRPAARTGHGQTPPGAIIVDSDHEVEDVSVASGPGGRVNGPRRGRGRGQGLGSRALPTPAMYSHGGMPLAAGGPGGRPRQNPASTPGRQAPSGASVVQSDDELAGPPGLSPTARRGCGSGRGRSPGSGRGRGSGRPGGRKEYIPKFRSGAHAVIRALYRAHTERNRSFLSKRELACDAQEFADEPMLTTSTYRPGTWYDGWSSVSTLTKKGLVTKMGTPAQYSLTEAGTELAQRLVDLKSIVESRSGEQSGRCLSPRVGDSGGRTGASGISKGARTVRRDRNSSPETLHQVERLGRRDVEARSVPGANGPRQAASAYETQISQGSDFGMPGDLRSGTPKRRRPRETHSDDNANRASTAGDIERPELEAMIKTGTGVGNSGRGRRFTDAQVARAAGVIKRLEGDDYPLEACLEVLGKIFEDSGLPRSEDALYTQMSERLWTRKTAQQNKRPRTALRGLRISALGKESSNSLDLCSDDERDPACVSRTTRPSHAATPAQTRKDMTSPAHQGEGGPRQTGLPSVPQCPERRRDFIDLAGESSDGENDSVITL